MNMQICFGYTFFEVATGSMANTIEIGDIVFVEITKDVNENDIIVYKEKDNYITHRLIKKDGETLTTKGDANNSEDFPININQVLGKVSLTIPKVGIFRKIFLTKEVIGLIAILVIFIAVLFFYNKTEDKDEK